MCASGRSRGVDVAVQLQDQPVGLGLDRPQPVVERLLVSRFMPLRSWPTISSTTLGGRSSIAARGAKSMLAQALAARV